MKKGFLFIISGPSAVGKTVVSAEVFKKNPSISKVVTYTTRPMRATEQNGVDYHFVYKEKFLELEKNGEFVEFSLVYGNYYGVRLSSLTEAIEQGRDQLLLINWEGFQKIKRKITSNVFGFFLTTDMKELERRIRTRATDSEEVIQNRLKMAAEDMQHKNEFDLCVENVEIQDTAQKILTKMQEIKGAVD